MRLVVVMSEASPWCRELAHRLVAAGVQVHVVDFADARDGAGYLSASDPFQQTEIAVLRDAVAGVHHLRSRAPGQLRYLAAAPQLARIFRRTGADVLLTLYGGGNALLAWASGVRPYAVYAVGSDVLFMTSGLRRHLGAHTLSAAAAVFANGEYLAARTAKLAPAARVTPLLLGIDLAGFEVHPRANAPLEVVCTRGFMPVYANEVIVQAAASIDPGIEFRLSFTSTGPELERTRAAATILPGAAGRVHFLGGVGRDDLVARLERADVYVSAARSDGTSISMLEALASGAYPVVTDLPQNREWIGPGRGMGELVPADSVAGFAHALARALSAAETRRRAAGVNRTLVEERADAARNTITLINELEHVARGRARAA